MKSIAKLVHRSFRGVERFADWLTGSAGPLFIVLCIILVIGGIWTFFSTMFAELAQPPVELSQLFRTRSPAHIALGLAPSIYGSIRETPLEAFKFFAWLAVCLYIIWCIGWHYYMACTEPPGSVLEGLGDSVRERRTGPGSGIWWARYRKRAFKASGPAVPRLALTTTVRPGEELAFEPASPIRDAASLDEPHRAGSRSSSGSGTKAAHLVAASRSSSHRSSSSASSILPGSPRPAKTPLPLSIQDAELRLPPAAAASALDSEDDADHDADDEDDTFPIARMCHKCPKVMLSKALAVLPPELRKIEKQIRAKAPEAGASVLGQGFAAGEEDDEGEAEIRGWLGDGEAEKLVPPPKPERAHHCRTCKTCILKYDHHCPWINACVGIGNERYFVLFMMWLSIGCGVVCVGGWGVVRRSVEFRGEWPYSSTPRICVLLLYVLAAVMGFALAVMSVWQLYLIARGETSVENSDNAYYRQVASKRGQDFINVYNVGGLKNLQLFFNVGPGSPHGYHTILLPKRIPPYSDGWHWAKKRGLAGRHAGVKPGEELTDEEVDHQDEHDVYRPTAPTASEMLGDGAQKQ
ncbi:hypothetical protein ACQY0O_002209 [Thecaphora frezii]